MEHIIIMAHDVIIDVIKLDATRKLTCLLNVVQHIFIDSLSINMLEIFKNQFFLALL